METSQQRVSQITVISTSHPLKVNSDKDVHKVSNYTVLGALHQLRVKILLYKNYHHCDNILFHTYCILYGTVMDKRNTHANYEHLQV